MRTDRGGDRLDLCLCVACVPARSPRYNVGLRSGGGESHRKEPALRCRHDRGPGHAQRPAHRRWGHRPSGISITSGPSVQILNSVVRHLQNGINEQTGTDEANLLIEDTIVSDNAHTGIAVYPNGINVRATLNRITAKETLINAVAGRRDGLLHQNHKPQVKSPLAMPRNGIGTCGGRSAAYRHQYRAAARA
jgi:hypothetical protein